jgi:hypothetical protein
LAAVLAAALLMGIFPFASRWQRSSLELTVSTSAREVPFFPLRRPATPFSSTLVARLAIRRTAASLMVRTRAKMPSQLICGREDLSKLDVVEHARES